MYATIQVFKRASNARLCIINAKICVRMRAQNAVHMRELRSRENRICVQCGGIQEHQLEVTYTKTE